MKKLIAILVALSFMAVAAPVAAQSQSGDELDSQFIDFEGMDIEGKREGGAAEIINPTEKAKFDRLHDLKKNFTSKIGESSDSAALQ